MDNATLDITEFLRSAQKGTKLEVTEVAAAG
jgi:hypothetical protein